MLILYVAFKYDYGKPEQGYSFEHYNFYDALVRMGHDILYFDFPTLIEKHGRDWTNRRLLEVVRAEKPKLMFTILFKDEIESLSIKKISNDTETVTLNWFCDDHWRFNNYSRYWAPCFNWVVTTAKSALPKYAKIGYRNVIKSQWACNHSLYRKLDLPLKYDVTFVGQPHGNRCKVIQKLRDAEIDVHTWGAGWDSGHITQDEMIKIFNQSRINLNLSNASTHIVGLGEKTRKWLSRSLNHVPLVGPGIRGIYRKGRSAAISSKPLGKTSGCFKDINNLVYPEQIKARDFEIPGCGGFLLTGETEDLANYYDIGKEVVCFKKPDELIEKVRYYLRHKDERAAIAQAGYRRVLREHTYVHRFKEIFERMELPLEQFSVAADNEPRPGLTQEIS